MNDHTWTAMEKGTREGQIYSIRMKRDALQAIVWRDGRVLLEGDPIWPSLREAIKLDSVLILQSLIDEAGRHFGDGWLEGLGRM